MTRAPGRHGDTLSQWLAGAGIVADDAHNLGDAERVRGLLIAAAREARSVSYSELLGELGHRFTRPKMRALCKTLDAIDLPGEAAGEPALAVLVVRESDRLPGQGWWVGREGPTSTSAEARAFVDQQQRAAFDYWRGRPPAQ